ncbi:methionine-R-sulfoxide reductase B1 isoform X5 [Cryptotermes secundus]|uniref:methionine-R-sulfoxide reductase B1 isoform X5 n=1 Tax=Cryptotermes secundus TaxID=105785 RepID=UPI000CD7B497|nr:methionine-R-sulfoxide reductase B1 isoform X5 [Cryptotermes secundus]
MSDSAKDQNGKAELKKRLTPMQYHVTQEKGTERAFTGKYYKTKDAGLYTCVVCGEELFSSETKFDSGCGWPAFNDVLDQGKVKLTKDTSHVLCLHGCSRAKDPLRSKQSKKANKTKTCTQTKELRKISCVIYAVSIQLVLSHQPCLMRRHKEM